MHLPLINSPLYCLRVGFLATPIVKGFLLNRIFRAPLRMREYNRDQMKAYGMVRRYLKGLSRSEICAMKKTIRPYLRFRREVGLFQDQYFSALCTRKCFSSQASACCNRDGIATFFADVVINVLVSEMEELDAVMEKLSKDRGGFKCVYLTPNGCIWRLKPIVCEMFLCKYAKDTVFGKDEQAAAHWEALREDEKQFTWPDKPVLFDTLEALFIQAGYDSPLMYFHKGPGLLRVKKRAHNKKPHGTP